MDSSAVAAKSGLLLVWCPHREPQWDKDKEELITKRRRRKKNKRVVL